MALAPFPQVVFRDTLPDEAILRVVKERHEQAPYRDAIASVTVRPVGDSVRFQAELKLLDWLEPIHALGETSVAAVHRAFDLLNSEARATA